MYFRHREDHYAVGNYHHEPIVTPQPERGVPAGAHAVADALHAGRFRGGRGRGRASAPRPEGRMRPTDPERSINGMFSFTPDAGSIVGESSAVRGVWICEAV